MPATPTLPTWISRARVFAMAAGVLAGAALVTPAALACGYENPALVALGLLNWVYPKALYVRTAVWQAENAGVLPPRATEPVGSLGYQLAAASMNGLGQRMDHRKRMVTLVPRTSSLADRPLDRHRASIPAVSGETSFSIVLLPAVMWTRFARVPEGYDVQVHADGPAQGDVVIVTDLKVIRTLLDGALTFADAEFYGLMRLYGDAQSREAVRSILAKRLQNPPDSPRL